MRAFININASGDGCGVAKAGLACARVGPGNVVAGYRVGTTGGPGHAFVNIGAKDRRRTPLISRLTSAEVGSDGIGAQGIRATWRSINAFIYIDTTCTGGRSVAIPVFTLTGIRSKSIGTISFRTTDVGVSAFISVGTTHKHVAFITCIAKAGIFITKGILATLIISVGKTFAQLIVRANKIVDTWLMIADFGTHFSTSPRDIIRIEELDPKYKNTKDRDSLISIKSRTGFTTKTDLLQQAKDRWRRRGQMATTFAAASQSGPS